MRTGSTGARPTRAEGFVQSRSICWYWQRLSVWAQISVEGLARQYEEKYIETVLWQKVQQEPDKALWLQMAGDLMQHKKMEQKALDAYEQAMTFAPVSPDLMNNLAWLLLTSEDLGLRDPQRALTLASSAAFEPWGPFTIRWAWPFGPMDLLTRRWPLNRRQSLQILRLGSIINSRSSVSGVRTIATT